MKVTVERASLLKSLGHVHRVVERRTTIPILSNVLLEASGNELRLKATDLDLEIIEVAKADISEPGAVTVPAHMLHDIVRKLSEGSQVSLETSGDKAQVQIRSGRSKFLLQSLPETDFPTISAGDMPVNFSIDSASLKLLINKTQFAISTEETRYYLNGIYLHTLEIDGALKMRAVATDGHRLARIEIPAPKGAEEIAGIIIPRKAVSEIQKLLEDKPDEVTIKLSQNKIRLNFDGIILTSKLIDGTFPDYSRVIPANNDKKLIVPRQDFARAVDRVSTISSERGRAVKLSLGDGKLTLSVNNPDSGSAVEEIEVDYTSSALEIGFNARYVLDIVGQLESDHATFTLADAGSPTLIQDPGQSSALYVLMPMRV